MDNDGNYGQVPIEEISRQLGIPSQIILRWVNEGDLVLSRDRAAVFIQFRDLSRKVRLSHSLPA